MIMEVIDSVREMQKRCDELHCAGRRIGLVPTMGYLHEGHLSLVRLIRGKVGEDGVVIVSIFVNPTQFGPGEDFEVYPRDFERDRRLCLREGVDLIFHPSAAEMYVPGATVYVSEDRLSRVLCGRSRPGHFRGVLTVVAKLFNMIRPDVAVFGRKDAQQLRLIERMVTDLNYPIEIVAAPIVRESDGLAMSSRNTYLSEHQRRQALCLNRALQAAEKAFAAGERDPVRLKAAMASITAGVPEVEVEYIEIVDWETLERLSSPIERKALAAMAARVGGTRLIDNTLLDPTAK